MGASFPPVVCESSRPWGAPTVGSYGFAVSDSTTMSNT